MGKARGSLEGRIPRGMLLAAAVFRMQKLGSKLEQALELERGLMKLIVVLQVLQKKLLWWVLLGVLVGTSWEAIKAGVQVWMKAAERWGWTKQRGRG